MPSIIHKRKHNRAKRNKRIQKYWDSLNGPVIIKKPGNYPPIITTNPKPTPPDRYANPSMRAFIYNRDCGQCQYCGIEVSFIECNIDHVIPWPRGKTVEENLVVACHPCNELKYTQIIPKHLRPI